MQLLEHFASLTLHPKNAQELKGLILQLAIQGKLTANWRKENPDIEPATILLEKVKEEKIKLIKEKKIKKETPLPIIKKEDLVYNIPNKWESVRLGEIGDWGAGSTPLRSNSLFYDGTINWFKSGELNNDIIDYESNEKITELALKKASLRLNKPGDVLIAMYGATIGKTGILKVHGTTNQAVCACTPFSCISSFYLHLLLKGLKNIFINQGEGGAQPNISRIKIRTQIFALPPLEEQKEIVRVVEILFKEVEQLEQLTVERIALKKDYVTSALQQLTTQNYQKEWQSLQPHFKDFFTEKSTIKKLRETVLQLAVQGKLTVDWRTKNTEVEHASELLKRIQKEKAQLITEKKIKKESPLPTITAADIPFELPDGWVWCRLNDLGIIGSSSRVHQKDWQSEGIPFYRAREIVKLSRFGYVDNDLFITEELFNKFKENGSVPELNDIMITGVGTIGIPYIVNKEDRFYFKDASVLIFKNIFNLYSEYLDLFFSCQYWKNEIHKDSMGTTVHTLTISRAKLVPTILPPFEEQKAIVEKVTALMGLCDALEQEVAQSKVYSEQLMQSVLREVFEGGF
jgi:type I restriction enzyme S subunit